MNYAYFAIPIVTGFIGWGTNVIAVKMLFYPKKPLKLVFLSLHGVVPKRKSSLASSIAEIFDRELLSTSDLVDRLRGLEVSEEIHQLIDQKLDRFFERTTEANPMASMFLSGQMIQQLKDLAMEELMSALPEVQERLAQGIENEFRVRDFIEEKIRAFSTEQLEAITMHVATKELRTIEILGGVLGLLIGGIQLVVMYYFSL